MKETAYIICIFVETLLIFALGLLCLALIFGFEISKKTAYENCDSAGNYCLKINETENLIEKKYDLSIVHKDSPDYGFAIPYPNYIFTKYEVKNLVWTEEGVKLENELGLQLFIPKESYLLNR
jgi:hypothetical protein